MLCSRLLHSLASVGVVSCGTYVCLPMQHIMIAWSKAS